MNAKHLSVLKMIIIHLKSGGMGDGCYSRIHCQLIEGVNEADEFIHFLIPGILCVNKPACFLVVRKMLLEQFSTRP